MEPRNLGPEVVHYSIPNVDATGTAMLEVSEDIASAKLRVHAGDVLVSRLNPRKPRVLTVGYHDVAAVASTEFVPLTPIGVDARFLRYSLGSAAATAWLDARVQSVTRSHQRVDPELILHLPLLESRSHRQRRIADFLDDQVGRLDAGGEAIRQASRLASEKLSAPCSSVIEHVKGPRLPLRRVLRSVRTGRTPGQDEQHLWSESGLAWIPPGDFDDVLGLRGTEKKIDKGLAGAVKFPVFPPESALIVGIGATAGRVALLEQAASGNQQITALTPDSRLLPGYLVWSLWCMRHELLALAPFTTLPILNNEFLRSV